MCGGLRVTYVQKYFQIQTSQPDHYQIFTILSQVLHFHTHTHTHTKSSISKYNRKLGDQVRLIYKFHGNYVSAMYFSIFVICEQLNYLF